MQASTILVCLQALTRRTCWLQVFGKEAFAKVGKYFRALRFTCEGEGKHKLVGAASFAEAAFAIK